MTKGKPAFNPLYTFRARRDALHLRIGVWHCGILSVVPPGSRTQRILPCVHCLNPSSVPVGGGSLRALGADGGTQSRGVVGERIMHVEETDLLLPLGYHTHGGLVKLTAHRALDIRERQNSHRSLGATCYLRRDWQDALPIANLSRTRSCRNSRVVIGCRATYPAASSARK